MSFPLVVSDVVADLTAAGLNASIDARDINPPGVLVRPDALIPLTRKLSGHYGVRCALLLVTIDTDTATALADLDALYLRVLVAGPALSTDEQPFERLVLPSEPTGLPCLRLTTIPLFAPTAATRTA